MSSHRGSPTASCASCTRIRRRSPPPRPRRSPLGRVSPPAGAACWWLEPLGHHRAVLIRTPRRDTVDVCASDICGAGGCSPAAAPPDRTSAWPARCGRPVPPLHLCSVLLARWLLARRIHGAPFTHSSVLSGQDVEESTIILENPAIARDLTNRILQDR